MKAPLTHPSYYDIEKGCSRLALDIIDNFTGIRLDKNLSLVALSRGGLVPGVILSHLLDLPLTPICYSAKTGHGDNRNHLNNLPDLTALPGSNIILIDDIADSGHTLKEVSEYYQTTYCVETAVLYWKHGVSVHTPDYFWQRIEKDDPWIEFPWEV